MVKKLLASWKLWAFTGGGAFLTSFTIGLLSGNYFLICLFRAFLFGIIFLILTAVSRTLIEKYCPELMNDLKNQTPEYDNKRESKNLNISIDENYENTPLNLKEVEEIEEIAEKSSSSFSEIENTLLDEKNNSNKEIGFELNKNSELEISNQLKNEFLEEDEKNVVQELETASENAEVSDSISEKDKSDTKKNNLDKIEDLDTLPDLSSFESTFAPVTGSSETEEASLYSNFGSNSLKTNKLEKDPVTYAKALRTIIKRDEGKQK